MAHYALINDKNIVVQVITGIDETETQIDTDGTVVGGSTEAWEAFYANLPWHSGLTCKRTSYNARGKEGDYRGIYAGIGYTYDAVNDVFVARQAPEAEAES